MKKIIIVVICVFLAVILNGQKPVDYLLKGKALTKAGKADEAVKILTDALQVTQESELYLERAAAFMEKGDYSQAIKDLNSANNFSPSSGEYGLARIYALKGDAGTSLYHLEISMKSPLKRSEKEVLLDPSFSVIENRPEWRQFWKKEWYGGYEKALSEIEYCLSAGKKDEARALLNELTSDYPGNDGNIYAQALYSLSTANYPDVVKAVSGLLENDPKNEKYLRTLALAQEGAGNPAGASSAYTQLIDMGIPDADLLLLRAGCFRKTGESAKALTDIKKYLDLYPDDNKALSFAGKVEAASGDNLAAIEYFSENLKLHPNDPECYIDRANSYFVSKSWSWAIKDYSMSLDLQPGNSDIWLSKGIALLNSGKVDDACHDFRKSYSMGNKRATEYISRNCIK